MNGWTLLALVLGYIIGVLSGARAQRRRDEAKLEYVRSQIKETVATFAKDFPMDVTIQVVDQAGTTMAQAGTKKRPGDLVH